MKKLLCIFLSAALLAALAVPSLAAAPPEESMDAAMEDVTLAVKETLQIGDGYTEFSGDWSDGVSGRWNFYWSGDDGSLSVSADADGKVMDYWRYSSAESSDHFYGFDPQFPALSETEAEKQAEGWLSRLMGEGETARIDTRRTELDDGSYRYGGVICLDGLDSPITFSMQLLGDGTLRSYDRSDAYMGYVGSIPAADAKVTEQEAADALADVVEMELYWVSDGAGGASLRYVPSFARHIVDAESGEPVDMDARYAEFNVVGYGPETGVMTMEAAAMDVAGGNGLTEIEQAAVAGYAEAMEADELDALLRGIETLGLDDGFALLGASYSQTTDGDIHCDLTYTKTMTDDQLYGYSRENYEELLSWGDELTIRKYLRVDAKDGTLESVSTYYPLWEKDGEERRTDTKSIAEAFLAEAASGEYAQSALCTLSSFSDETVWAQVEGGYFYPENRLTVVVNEASCTVDEYERDWEDDVTFGSDRIVKESKAVAAYIDALDVTLGYSAWPVFVSESADYAVYNDYYGYSWVEQLKLAWYYTGTDAIAGVDAVSGEIVSDTPDGAGYTYTDLDGCEAKKAIERLGAAGIGFDGGSFVPDEGLDMRTAATLLLQAAGYDPSGWDDERLGEFFVSNGMIESGAWKPESAVSRMDFLKMLLGASRYGAACQLEGVWQTEYEDWAVVSKADRGYAALAQALGLVTDGQLKPSALCTRAMAAQMLCAFLDRG